MKKHLKPNLEFIFSISLMAILGLPLLVFSQTRKSFEIRISNGDTTINGKDIKSLSARERKDALAEIGNMPQTFTYKNGSQIKSAVIIKRSGPEHNQTKDVIIERSFDASDMPMMADADEKDSLRKTFKLRLKKVKGGDSTLAFNYELDSDPIFKIQKPFVFERELRNREEFNHPNTQLFTYSNTDNDGINTHISFRVTEPAKDKIKRLTGAEKAGLIINDLTIAPEFSTGKTVLSFNLPAKTTAEVTFTSTDGKVVWTDKALAGSFSKKMNLSLNGVYYLQIKQGSAIAVKKIIKEG